MTHYSVIDNRVLSPEMQKLHRTCCRPARPPPSLFDFNICKAAQFWWNPVHYFLWIKCLWTLFFPPWCTWTYSSVHSLHISTHVYASPPMFSIHYAHDSTVPPLPPGQFVGLLTPQTRLFSKNSPYPFPWLAVAFPIKEPDDASFNCSV